MMDRRTFLKLGIGTLGAAHLSRGQFLSAFAAPSPGAARSAGNGAGGRVLVVVRFDGGNDGLNTVLALDQYDALSKARANILVPEPKALKLDANTGLHPAMTGLHKVFQDGNLRIVQAVGYPNHNQSHFRSTDIWFTGSDSNQVLESGVIGRTLDGKFPDFPVGYPNEASPHPPSIQIGATLFTLLQGDTSGMGMAIGNPSSVYSLKSDGIDTAPATPAGHELAFIRQMASQTRLYGDALKVALGKAATKSSLYPATGNPLADQLKGVARLIAGGLETQVYVLSIGGFDTHSAQVQESDPATGKHADLLRQVSDAVAAFLDDLRLLGVDDRVVGVTMSEFGRRILSNASFGTDHGTAAPLFVFGTPVDGGITGTNPAIPAKATSSDNVPMQTDFRSVYATLLRDWLQLDPIEVRRILQRDFPVVGFLQKSYWAPVPAEIPFALHPVRRTSRGMPALLPWSIDFPTDVRIDLVDLRGRVARTLVNGPMPAGRHETPVETSSLGAGHYVVSMRVGNQSQQQPFELFH